MSGYHFTRKENKGAKYKETQYCIKKIQTTIKENVRWEPLIEFSDINIKPLPYIFPCKKKPRKKDPIVVTSEQKGKRKNKKKFSIFTS